jgi:hypothetical protein
MHSAYKHAATNVAFTVVVDIECRAFEGLWPPTFLLLGFSFFPSGGGLTRTCIMRSWRGCDKIGGVFIQREARLASLTARSARSALHEVTGIA